MAQRASVGVHGGAVKFDGDLVQGACLPDSTSRAGAKVLVEKHPEIGIEASRVVAFSPRDVGTEFVGWAWRFAIETQLNPVALLSP